MSTFEFGDETWQVIISIQGFSSPVTFLLDHFVARRFSLCMAGFQQHHQSSVTAQQPEEVAK